MYSNTMYANTIPFRNAVVSHTLHNSQTNQTPTLQINPQKQTASRCELACDCHWHYLRGLAWLPKRGVAHLRSPIAGRQQHKLGASGSYAGTYVSAHHSHNTHKKSTSTNIWRVVPISVHKPAPTLEYTSMASSCTLDRGWERTAHTQVTSLCTVRTSL